LCIAICAVFCAGMRITVGSVYGNHRHRPWHMQPGGNGFTSYIDETKAASLAYGLDRMGRELRIAVIDPGGDALDVTIMKTVRCRVPRITPCPVTCSTLNCRKEAV